MTKFRLLTEKKLFFYIFFFGLTIRLIFLYMVQSADINSYMLWNKVILEEGTAGFYEKSFAVYKSIDPNYPPVIIYAFLFFAWFYEFLIQFIWFLNITIPLFPSTVVDYLKDFNGIPGFLKLPAVLCDIGVAYLIYLFTKKLYPHRNKSLPLLLAGLVLFNPAFFYNSSLWGQVDIIPIFFVLLALYLVLYTKKQILSPIMLTLALLFKQTVVIFLPIFLLIYLKKMTLKQFVISLIPCIILIYAAFLPFYTSGNMLFFPFVTYWNEILTASSSHFATYHAFNFWALATGLEFTNDVTNQFAGISYHIWGYILTGSMVIALFVRLIKHQLTSYNIIFALCLIAFTCFIFLTRMHERHFLQVLPFFVLIVGTDKKLLGCFIILSLFHLFNMYHDWWWPVIPFAKELLSLPFLINGSIIVMLGIYVYLCIIFFKRTR